MLELRRAAQDSLTAARSTMIERLTQHRMIDQYGDADAARAAATARIDQVLTTAVVEELVEEGRPVGFVCWKNEHADLGLVDVRLDDPAGVVADLLPILERLADEQGARRITVGSWPGDDTRSSLASLTGFRTIATNMELRLEEPIEDPGEDPEALCLRAMTQTEFDAFYSVMVTSYAADLAESGMTEADALHEAATQSLALLPDGLASPDTHFFTGVVGDGVVGTLWLSTERPMAYVYDVEIDAAHRRRGLGRAIMNAGARWCQERGIFALGLNVFGHNPAARALYDSLGYVVTEDYRALDRPSAD